MVPPLSLPDSTFLLATISTGQRLRLSKIIKGKWHPDPCLPRTTWYFHVGRRVQRYPQLVITK